MSTLMLNYDELETQATKLQTEGSDMRDCIDAISTIVKELPDIWQAQTGERYVEQFSELKPSLDETVNLIDEMVEQMKKIASNFQEADLGMANQM